MLVWNLKEGFRNKINRKEYYIGNSIFKGDFMGKGDISVDVNYPKGEEDLKELEERKARIMIDILREKYGNVVLEEYISSMKEKMKDYS